MTRPNDPPRPHRLLATATAGLEAVVARELRELGYEPRIIDTGRVAFDGDDAAIVRANLWLRSADRVLLEVGRFEARDFGALFDQTHALPWEAYVPANGYFPVSGRSVKSQLSSVPACQRSVKKAIAEKLLAAHRVSRLPDQPGVGPQCAIEVAIRNEEASLTLDTSGDGLHKRGYRQRVGAAPLKETLAAGLVLLSFWDRERPMLDPFCGSGTLPIEAAMIGREIAPGLHRGFAAETWPWLGDATWEAGRAEARGRMKPDLPVRIIGTDVDAGALDLAREHARLAGVDADIHFQQRDFAELAAKHPYGCLITNPPWGQRLGEDEQLLRLYAQMPIVLAKLETWSFFILTAYPEFEKLVGQEADRRRKLYNAQIACTYYSFHGPRPPRDDERATPRPEQAPAVPAEDKPTPLPRTPARAIPKPAFGGLPERAADQAREFRNRLTKVARHLRKWPTKHGITCYRLYERDIPDVPLVVDRYEQCLHMAEYERPNDHTLATHQQWLDLMQKTAAEALEVDPKKVFFKYRRRQRGLTQHERYGEENRTFVVQEGGLKFKVNLSDYVDTGLFLDHRITRGMVREQAAGRRMLNLFAYTGAFTVYAAAGGAASTTTVDLSNTYLDWAAENLVLNGFAVDGKKHSLVRDDTLSFLHHLRPKRGGHFDLAVVDPPTFSNSKRTDDVWDVNKDHAELLNSVAKLMSPGGEVFFSTNSRRFKLDEPSLASYATIREITQQTIPPDFRNKRIHRCWRLTTPTD